MTAVRDGRLDLSAIRLVGLPLVAVLAAVLAPSVLGGFWVTNLTQAVIFSIVAASAGLLYGRVGLVSLGQVAPYGVGTWATMRLGYATDLPWPALLLVGGVAGLVLGVVIGLPALRVSGLYLALVTLMLVAAVEVLLVQFRFPNGGSGVSGVTTTLSEIRPLERPSFATSDAAYFRFCVVVTLVLFVVASWMLSSKPGRAWASIQQSEPASLSAGIDVTRYKILAFALAAFMAGVAGALFAGSVQSSIGVDQFSRQAALFLIAAVLMGGTGSLWGALLAGFFAKLFLDLLVEYVPGGQVWNDFGLSLFGIGLMVNLIVTTRDMERRGLLS